MPSIVRVRPDVTCVVYDSETDTHVPLRPDMRFAADAPLVREHPWAFQRDAEVEQATAGPGEKRGGTR